ncbi:MAG: zinc-dependent alcohol dehydrogenase family protein [Methanosarcinaceae archaeon]|nr:zinc-dependent alcohol dehydrogenase family protein [Methanosarcinaceae archaeon]
MSDYKAVRFSTVGGPDVLEIERTAFSPVGDNEVRLKLLAIGVNQGDAMYRTGTYLELPDFPSGLGTEACGEIVEVGRGVETISVGDRVSVHSSHSLNRYPLYGEFAVMPVTSLVPTPEAFTDEEGAAFTLAYIPMYLALTKEAHLKAGETVLLNAGAATTSMAASQIARMLGAVPIAIVRSQAKADQLAGVGYDRIFVAGASLVDDVRKYCPGGVDVVLDPVAGPGSQRLSEMAAQRGRIIHYGALDTPIVEHSIYQLAPKFISVSGFTIYGYSGSDVLGIPRDDASMREAVAFISQGALSGHLKPLIAKQFKLDDIADAHRALAAGTHIGKIIVTP